MQLNPPVVKPVIKATSNSGKVYSLNEQKCLNRWINYIHIIFNFEDPFIFPGYTMVSPEGERLSSFFSAQMKILTRQPSASCQGQTDPPILISKSKTFLVNNIAEQKPGRLMQHKVCAMLYFYPI
jgi:hypothetical protein